MNRELLKRTLVHLVEGTSYPTELIEEIKNYLAQPEPEPVIEVKMVSGYNAFVSTVGLEAFKEGTKLYTSSPNQSARIAELEESNKAWVLAYNDLKQELEDLQARLRCAYMYMSPSKAKLFTRWI